MKSALPPVELLGNAMDDVNALVDTSISISSAWKPLLENIQLFMKIADQVSEVCYSDWILTYIQHAMICAIHLGAPLC